MEPQQPINVLWERLHAADPASVAARAAVAHDATLGIYRVPLLAEDHRVDPAARTVSWPGGKAAFDATLLCVQYLLTCQDEPLAGEWVNPRTLPMGEFFFRGLHQMPTGKLEAAFGPGSEALGPAARGLGGEPLEVADAAFAFPALPRVPVALTWWDADDEFPARAQFLLDRWADHHLPLDALWLLCGHVARRLVAAARGD